tara:strand:+ start:77 stop:253 length:177 start_codon:yes stop_codon:yes gene_type:complete
MTKNFKPDELIGMIQKKVLLKKSLKELKSNGENKKAEVVELKISQLDDELHSRPLSKN